MLTSTKVQGHLPPGGLSLSEMLFACALVLGSVIPAAAQAQLTNTVSRPAYATFRIITERNIFNPKRISRNSPRPERPASHVDSFTLVGTMSYDKGDLAFFEGNRPDLKKVAKVSDVIAGYKITNISYHSVQLSSETNALQHEVKLAVGMQMRREDEGAWHLASAAESTSSASTPSGSVSAISNGSSDAGATAANSTADSTSSSTGSDDPVLKRLMQKREQENNR